ncbi:regenerating islet-derived protein 3-beta isoform X2 [Fukomys damarensis]|uniref:regenerating islet-derived protein 3-beta isoform X2 n=1 Tax=Fukomys damarensis TaxID=885580 RepID=UPI00053F8279|nr:regenerating islet-derived protein 3-beta isoform X2 [Fukomys damarensis]
MLAPVALCSVSWLLLSSLMLLSQVQGEDSQDTLASTRINCPRGAKAYGPYCYSLFRTPKSWTDANGLESNGLGWEWSNSDILDYTNWERNPSSGSDHGFCGSVSRASGFLKWRDYNCAAQLPYVCKFKG